MRVPLLFNCEKCKSILQSEDREHAKPVKCDKCGHVNIPPTGFEPPPTAKLKVKKRYFGE